MPWWFSGYNLIHEDDKWDKRLIWNAVRTSRNLTSIQSDQQDTRQFGRPPRAKSATKRLVYLKENAPNSAFFTQLAEMPRCLALINLVKTNTLRVKWDISY